MFKSYFSKQRRKNIKDKNEFNILDEFDSLHSLSPKSIVEFLDYCQGKDVKITNSNALHLNYLSTKYLIYTLQNETEEYIKKNHKQMIREFFIGKPIKKTDKFSKSLSNISKIDKFSQSLIINKKYNDDDDKDDNDDDDNDNDSQNSNKKEEKKVKFGKKKRIKKIRRTKSYNKKQETSEKDDENENDESTNDENNNNEDNVNENNNNEENSDENNADEKNNDEDDDDYDENIPKKKIRIIKKKKPRSSRKINFGSSMIIGKKKKPIKKKSSIKSKSETDEEISEEDLIIEKGPKYLPEIYEQMISEFFIDYISSEKDLLFMLPISNLLRILFTFSQKNHEDDSETKSAQNEQEIINFLFEFVSKNKKESTILLTVLDFSFDGIEYFNDKLHKYAKFVDFNCLSDKIYQNSQLLLKQQKMKEQSIINQLEDRHKEKEEENQQKINEIVVEMKKQQDDKMKSFESALKEIKEKQDIQIQKLIDDIDSKYKQKETKNEQILNQMKIEHENEIQILNDKIKLQESQIVETKLIILTNMKNDIEIPDSIIDSSFSKITIPSSFTVIDANFFSCCSCLKEIIIPTSVKTIEENAFNGCTSLKQLVIPNSVTNIKSCAFNGCENLTQLTIDLNKTKFEDDSFNCCSSLNCLILSSETNSIQPNDFKDRFQKIGQIKKIIIPITVIEIESNSFEGCSSIEEIVILSSVKEIGSGAFSDCSSLIKIELPPSITKINDKTFSNCTSLKRFVIPELVTKIGNNAFDGCSSLEQIELTSNVNEIGSGAFSDCKSLTSITIPRSLNKINNNTFNGCSSLEQILIHSRVKKIGSLAFNKCTNLSRLTIDLNKTNLESDSFNECTSLNCLVLSSETNSIQPNDFHDRFQKIGQIKKIIIPPTVDEIGNNSFEGCSSIEEIVIPPSVKEIGFGAFSDCSSLNKITLPESITKIYENTFSNCNSLTQITIPSSVTHIWGNAFSGCSSLTHVDIPSSVIQIGNFAFNGCVNLTEIEIPNSIKSIGSYDFKEKPEFKDINFSLIMELFKKSVFFGCNSLKKIKFLDIDIRIDKYAEIEQYEIKEKISSNFDTDVYKAVKKSTNKEYAIKAFSLQSMKNFRELFRILNSLPDINGIVPVEGYHLPLNSEDHQIICKNAYDYTYEQFENYLNKYIVISEYMGNGNLDDKLNILGQNNKDKIIFEVASVLKKLHEINIFDINISFQNIYLDENLNPKINAFSVSKYICTQIDVYSNPNYEYVAPEVIPDNLEFIGSKSDIYSFSIFLYKMFSSTIKILGSSKSEHQYIQYIMNGSRPDKPNGIPEMYWDLIEKCWSPNPIYRPTADEIVNILNEKDFEENEFPIYDVLPVLDKDQNDI